MWTARLVTITISKRTTYYKDFQQFISGFEVLNKDLVICNMEPSVKLNIELTIEKGRGYIPEENKRQMHHLEQSYRLYFYANKNVKYAVEDYREQKTDYEKLIVDIKTGWFYSSSRCTYRLQRC